MNAVKFLERLPMKDLAADLGQTLKSDRPWA